MDNEKNQSGFLEEEQAADTDLKPDEAVNGQSSAEEGISDSADEPDNEETESEIFEEQPPEYFSPMWYIKRKLREKSPKAVSAAAGLKKYFNLETLLIFIFIAAVATVGYYILFPSRGEFHSDTTDTILWAQASLESKSAFNEDFCYACLLPFGGHLIMMPFVAIFGVSVKAQVLGMFTFFLLFVITMYVMLKRVGWSTKWCCLTVAFTILLISGSEKLREIFWGHVIYYSLGLLFAFVGISIISGCIDKLRAGTQTKIKFTISAVLLFVWCFLTGLNQIESLTIFLVPAFAAVVAERFFANDRAKTPYEYFGNIIIAAAVLAGSVLGFIACNKLADGLVGSYESAYSGFSDIGEWKNNFEIFYQHWVTLFGIDIARGMHILTVEGVINLIKVIVCVIFVVAPVIMLFNYKKIKERKMRILLLFHWFMTALVMMGYILGLLASANWRLSPILCTSVIITFACAKMLWETLEIKRVALVFMIPLMIVGTITGKYLILLPSDYRQDEGYYLIARDLNAFEKELGFKLDYGYATFWNANIITLITDSEIPVRSIMLSQNSYYPYEYQTQRSWYEDQEDVDKYFVLLSPAEYSDVISNNNDLINPEMGLSQICYAISEGYYVLVYDQNIF